MRAFAPRLAALALVALSFPIAPLASQARGARPAAPNAYYPGAGDDWERRPAQQVGMDQAKLDEAIAFAKAAESPGPRNLEIAHYQTFGREPFGDGVGPFKERGEQSGVVIRNGYIVAEWGDMKRVDMTFSVTKSFVSTTVGLAFDRGMIRSVNDLVRDYLPPIVTLGSSLDPSRSAAERIGEQRLLSVFETEHNRKITWDHLLRQTSDWEGTLWGKPEWADRPNGEPNTWRTRARNAPGTSYEYNDVRVNALALASLNVWRRPLPQVLREMVMDPIGASTTWRWYGYDNSWVLIDGEAMQSVAGGGHWGGGMFISGRDLARFGYLTLRRGKWKDRQILSENWVRMALTPTQPQPTYGFMNWFLNTDKKMWASAPASAWAHLGNGTNMVYCDPENDLVVVARWIQNNQIDAFLQRVIGSITTRDAAQGTTRP
jgi:CubicO group peptidase (beta-lactamase class C family)